MPFSGRSSRAHKLVDITECRGLVCLVEMEARTVCVVRSRTPEFDAARLAPVLGGGGHAQAAPATPRGRGAGGFVGVVTRSDLLRALGEPAQEPPLVPSHDLRERLLALPTLEPVFG